MGRKRMPIFPLFEEFRRVTASLSDEQMGKAIRYALACYYDGQSDTETDALTRLAADMLLDQAARYDNYRDQQRSNARNRSEDGAPNAADSSHGQPSAAKISTSRRSATK